MSMRHHIYEADLATFVVLKPYRLKIIRKNNSEIEITVHLLCKTMKV